MSKRLTFSSLVTFGSKKIYWKQEKQNIFPPRLILYASAVSWLWLVNRRKMATGGKRGKLAISAPVTCWTSTGEAIRDISGARGGHFDARIELINKVKSDLSGIMHRLYVLCSSHHYIWNPWAFVPGFRPLFSVFLRDRLIKTIMETRKENKSSFNRWVS